MQDPTPKISSPPPSRSEAVKDWQDQPTVANAEAAAKTLRNLPSNVGGVAKTLNKPASKPFVKPPPVRGTARNTDKTPVTTAGVSQIVAAVNFCGDASAGRACHRGPVDGYPVRLALSAGKKCVVVPRGEWVRIRTGMMVDAPIRAWSQASGLDSQAAISKVQVEDGEVIAYVTGVGADITIYESTWLVLFTLGDVQ